MREFCGAQVKDSTQRCEFLSTLSASPVLSGLPLLDTRCWTSWCLLIQHGCSCSGNSASLQEISFLTELPRQGEAIAFKEINKAGGFRKMGAMKNQFHVLENPKENSFEKQKWWRKLC